MGDPVPVPPPTWQRPDPGPGPGLHALLIGVAGYPFAKPDQGADRKLGAVEDVPCTVAAARRMADWLFDNRDALATPLASIDLLLSNAPPDPDRAPYEMRLQPQVPIEPATTATVMQHGRAWTKRFRNGDSAFFFISGHGALRGNDAVVFLSDLNEDEVFPWDAYVNVTETARALKGDTRLKTAFFFADACQEYAARFNLLQTKYGAAFVTQDPERSSEIREKVAFIGAASPGRMTLEGEWNDAKPPVMMGRFTQVLIDALDGASSRLLDDVWGVHAAGIFEDLIGLYRLRNWTGQFDPTMVFNPNEQYPVVFHPEPKVPVVVLTNPADRLSGCLLQIFKTDRNTKAIERCEPGTRASWVVRLTASDSTHFVVANHSSGIERFATVTPNQPIFGRTVKFV